MLLLSATLAVTACGKKDGDADKSSAKPGEAAKQEPKPEPFRGKLTEEVLSKGNRAISAYTPDGQPAEFAATLASAKVALGEPTHVDGATYAWGFAEGDKCTYYTLVDNAGKAKASGVQSIDKAMSSMYGKCMAAIGAAK